LFFAIVFASKFVVLLVRANPCPNEHLAVEPRDGAVVVGRFVERRALLGVETAIFWHWPSNARRSIVKLVHYHFGENEIYVSAVD
jgi:hypothetical protein